MVQDSVKDKICGLVRAYLILKGRKVTTRELISFIDTPACNIRKSFQAHEFTMWFKRNCIKEMKNRYKIKFKDGYWWIDQ